MSEVTVMMTDWDRRPAARWSSKMVIGLALLAVLLVAAVPVALFTGLLLMLFGHVVGGLAVFGGSVLAAVIGVGVAGMSGLWHLRRTVERALRVVRLDRADWMVR